MPLLYIKTLLLYWYHVLIKQEPLNFACKICTMILFHEKERCQCMTAFLVLIKENGKPNC